jgi:hypothetical protein
LFPERGNKMAANKRKIGLYSIAGIAASIIIIFSIFASGIPIPPSSNNQGQPGSQKGTLTVAIKDAPVDLQGLMLTIDSMYVQNANDGQWTELTLGANQPVTFDLLSLKDTSLKLSQDAITAGSYTKIRLSVTSATATYTDNKGVSHPSEELKVPSGHIDIITSFQVGDNQVTGLLIDMQPDTAAISQSGNFRPIIKMTVTQETLLTPTPTPSTSPSASPSASNTL